MSDDALFYGRDLDVSPSSLWWLDGHEPRPVGDSPHHESAAAVLRGVPANATSYFTASLKYGPAGFFDLVRSVADRGWVDAHRIKIAVDDVGRMTICDGLHRASAALAANLTTVPVDVVYRHHRWWALRHLLRRLNGGTKLYQAINHPDLQWPAWRVDTQARAEAIAKHVGQRSFGIDVGCNSGALTCAVSVFGQCSMLGLDVDQCAVDAAKMLVSMHGIGGNAEFGLMQDGPLPKADFVVVLSVLNHFWTEAKREAEGRALFARCVDAAPMVFLDAPSSGDPIGGGTLWEDPTNVLEWCATVAPGHGGVLCTKGLMRPLIVWYRD